MKKNFLDFYKEIPEVEQQWYLEETWCDHCDEADLGIVNPKLCTEDDKMIVEGECKKCGNVVSSEIVEKRLKPKSLVSDLLVYF